MDKDSSDLGTVDSDLGTVDRVRAAREERDRRAAEYDAACGSPRELSAYTELQAAELQLAARSAWLSWTETGADLR
jgi:hypothetical protein